MTRDPWPHRSGPPPTTTPTNPHQQLDQTAPPALQERLWQRVHELEQVVLGPSGISVPGTRALHLDDDVAVTPGTTMIGREFAHLHPRSDGSLHLVLPEGVAPDVVAAGWAELHPIARRGLIPPTTVMVYGPRDDDELEVVWRCVRAAHRHAVAAARTP